MSFSEALNWLKKGKTIYRLGWGKSTWLELVPRSKTVQPYVSYVSNNGAASEPWVAPHGDLLANDWAYNA